MNYDINNRVIDVAYCPECGQEVNITNRLAELPFLAKREGISPYIINCIDTIQCHNSRSSICIMNKISLRYKVGEWYYGSGLDKRKDIGSVTENKIAKEQELKTEYSKRG